MEETCKESLINPNKKNIFLSIFPITEKKEEYLNSSVNNSKFEKSFISDKSSKNYIKRKVNKNNEAKIRKTVINFNKDKSSRSSNKLIGDLDINNINNKKEKTEKQVKYDSKKK